MKDLAPSLNKPFCFSRRLRLLTKADFQSVFDRSNKVNQKYLLALFKPNENNTARLGLIIGKRVAKKAVSRNQFKRIIRESFRQHQNRLPNLDMIIIARQQCDQLDKATLREGIDKLWEKLVQHYQNHSLS